MERERAKIMMGSHSLKTSFKALVHTSLVLILALCIFMPNLGKAQNSPRKKRSIRKVQEVNFSDMNLKGTLRNPDGAYLVQKRGIKFLPLYEVNKDMDARIRDSSFYVK